MSAPNPETQIRKKGMDALFQRINRHLVRFGFDARKFFSAITVRSPDWYARDLKEFLQQKGDDRTFPIFKRRAAVCDKDEQGGTMSGDYFHQDLFAARKIFEAAPRKHVDIGSRTDGFVAHVASFRPIEVFDIRPIQSTVKNITFRQADLMNFPAGMESFCDSVSSLHAIEHFGLGRYGDPIDYRGHLKALDAITRMLEPGGTFYFSVPIGPQRIEFNAHRVFSLLYLLEILGESYEVVSFSYVDDDGNLHEDVTLDDRLVASNCSCNYGCGIFILRKRRSDDYAEEADEATVSKPKSGARNE